MNFFDQVHETQITRYVRQPRIAPRHSIPLHRRLFAIEQPRDSASRAAR